MGKRRHISRRTLLQGAGVAISLPWLESVMPAIGSTTAAEAGPRRMAFFCA